MTMTADAIETAIATCEHEPTMIAGWSDPIAPPDRDGTVVLIESASSCQKCGAAIARLLHCSVDADGFPVAALERRPWIVTRAATAESLQWSRLRMSDGDR